MDEFGWWTIAGGSDSRPGPRRCSFECLAVTTAASGLCDWATKAPRTRGLRRRVWMLQIVVCSTAARARGLPLRPDVHNAADRDRSADSGRARQPMRRSRPSQPCSFCGRRCGALGRRRLGDGARHRSDPYPSQRHGDLVQVRRRSHVCLDGSAWRCLTGGWCGKLEIWLQPHPWREPCLRCWQPVARNRSIMGILARVS